LLLLLLLLLSNKFNLSVESLVLLTFKTHLPTHSHCNSLFYASPFSFAGWPRSFLEQPREHGRNFIKIRRRYFTAATWTATTRSYRATAAAKSADNNTVNACQVSGKGKGEGSDWLPLLFAVEFMTVEPKGKALIIQELVAHRYLYKNGI